MTNQDPHATDAPQGALSSPRANDIQVGGEHYKSLKPEPWDVIVAWDLPYLAGNVIKYVARYRNKGGIESLKKARHYLDKLIEVQEAQQ